ncbi:ABC transporter substrate-binding protein [Vallitalea okinawensis]|uniref:ABC transporter substrate-binding protein n=1 Tax=Vallitalea okinawensis TaxID=2078660 RepID=UPI0013003DBA|nr:ABC transporter substrate-binding protein [Vallitalea okinawensis]
MNKTKVFITMLLVLTMSISLIACSEKEEPSNEVVESQAPAKNGVNEEKKEVKEKPTDIVYFTSSAKYKDSYDVIADKVDEALNVAIDVQVVPDEQYTTLLKTKLSTREVPDIFDFNTPTGYMQLNVVENCVELSNEPWVERLVNPGLVIKEGQLYAMPRESSSFFPAMYYNKKIFAELNLEEPTTYDEFLNVLETIKQAGITPIHMADKENWTTQIFMTSGFSAALAPDRNDEVYGALRNNTLKHAEVPEFIGILEKYKNFYDMGYVNEDHMTATYDVSQDAVGSGKAAMMMNGEWVVSSIQNMHPDAEIGAFAVPLETGYIGSGAFVQGMFIPKASENVELAKVVLNTWSQPEYLNIFFEENPSFPAFNDVDPGDVPESVQKIVDQYVATGKTVLQYNNMFEEPSSLRPDYLWKYFVEMAIGEKTPVEALEAWDEDVADFMKTKGYAGW